jgi:hypothetical protein
MTLGLLAAVQWQTAQPWKSLPISIPAFRRWSAVATAVALLMFAGFIATNRLYEIEQDTRMFGAGISVRLDPPARDFIEKRIPGDARLFNSFNHGSRYLWWFDPDRRPFLDGNGDGYSPEFFAEYVRIVDGKQPFIPFARRHRIEWVYLGLDKLLARRLYHSPAWHPVFLDGDAIILVSRSPKFDELRRTIDLRADLARGIVPNWEPTPLPSLLQRTTPRRDRLLANFLFSIGELRAARTVRKHVQLFPPERGQQRK